MRSTAKRISNAAIVGALVGLAAAPVAAQSTSPNFRSLAGAILPSVTAQPSPNSPFALPLPNDQVKNKLRHRLKSQVRAIPAGQYIEAMLYLSNLDGAIKLLRQPDAGRYLSGHYAATGASVQELVEYMTRNGLGFTPALPGDEAVYIALHRAMAAVTINSQP